MCTNPQPIDPTTLVACRNCNECIAARKNTWVARAMAEKHTMGHASLLTLTYAPDWEGTDPPGAKAFHYQHVKTFLKHLRETYFRKHQARSEISFICAGERGERKDRVHWHIVVFSKRPILDLGVWTDYGGNEIAGPRLGQRSMLDFWDHWPHGCVDVIEPDQKGMAYVLKYALKDAYAGKRARGTTRERNAERFANSYFRMSKSPPIGHRWMEAKLDDWAKRGVVPTRPQIPVPEYSGYWYPTGETRASFLSALHRINEDRRASTGRDCATWSTLLNSVVSGEKDWEALVYGPQEQVEPFDLHGELDALHPVEAQSRRTCGRIAVCTRCYRGQSAETRKAYRAFRADEVRKYVTDRAEDTDTFDEWFRKKRTVNPFCALKDTQEVSQAFAA